MELMVLCGSTSDSLRQIFQRNTLPLQKKFRGDFKFSSSIYRNFIQKLSEMVIRNIKVKCILTLDVTIAFYINGTPFLICPVLI